MILRLALTFLAVLISGAVSAAPDRVLTLGIYAYRPPEVMLRRYQPLADYLGSHLPGIRIQLTALPMDRIEQAIQRHELDLVLTNPRHYVHLRTHNHLSGVIATLIKRGFDGSATDRLGGVILTRAERTDIQGLADLRGKRIAVPSLKHTGGYLLQCHEMQLAGLALPKRRQLDVVGTHDAVVRNVISGVSDVGFVRTEIIEELARDGRLDPSEIRVINPRSFEDFPFRISTRLYPEWPVVALPGVDRRTISLAMAALLELDPDGPVARAAGIAGFAPPLDYLPMEQAMRALRVPPFDQRPSYSFEDLWSEYQFEFVGGAVGLLIILALGFLLWYRNRALAATTERLRTLTHVQSVLAEQTAALMPVSAADQDAAINAVLETAGQLAGADRAYLFQLDADGMHISNTHEWCAEGIARQLENLQGLSLDELRWWWDQITRHGYCVIPDVNALPDDIAEFRQSLKAQDIHSLFGVALLKGVDNQGFVGFDMVRCQREWAIEEVVPFEAPVSALGHALLRWRAEQEQRASERFLDTLFESIPTPIFCKDLSGRYLRVNRGFEDFFNADRSLMIGRSTAELHPPGLACLYEDRDQELLVKGGLQVYEAQFRVADASLRDVVFHKTLFSDDQGRVAGLIGSVLDVTLLKQQERMLELRARRDEALLQLPHAAEGSDEMVLITCAQELAKDLTESRIAFFYFVSDDESSIEPFKWPKPLLEQDGQSLESGPFPLDETSICADAVRRRAPVVVNERVLHPGRQGLPELQLALDRLICVPVIENDRVVMISAVGNKTTDYDATDVETLQLIANEVWRLLRRRRDLAALRASEARFLSTFEQAAVGIAQVGLNGRWLRVNHKLCQILGYDSDELLEMTFREVTHPEDLGPDVELGRRLLAGEIPSFGLEKRYLRKDGAVVWVNVTVSLTLTEEGEPDYFISVIEDIQVRKEAEQQIIKLAQAVEQTVEGILITNLDAEIEYVNAAFVKNSGYGREELIGQNPRILHSGKTPKAVFESLWTTLIQGRSWQGEFINRRKDGEEYTDLSIITPLKQSDGRITHYVSVQENISEKKRVAEELDQHRHHLEELVEARTAELAQARLAAESASQAKSAFLANMSHEIRTPMNAILGMTHLLQRNARPDQQSRLEVVANSANHLLSLINDILDFSKIEAGKMELDRTDFKLSSVFEHVCSLISVQVKQKGLEFVSDHQGIPDWLHGDPLRLRQILLNLAGNAVKFTEHGQVSLRAQLLEETGRGLRVRFLVEDTGIGISEEEQRRLFQHFEQADVSISRQYGGSGLGLAISRRLVEMMDGQISVDSRPGVGSRFGFDVLLERGRGRMPERASAAAADIRFGGTDAKRRILLVEDNAINREVAMELLTDAELEVDTAENGEIALRKVEEGHYDLVLMDMQMPVMDGLTATRAIRRLPGMASLPILAMTANAFEEDRLACLSAGMNDFVSKPVDPDAMFTTLSRWLQPADARPVPEPPAPRVTDEDSATALPAALRPFETPDLHRALAVMRGDVGRFVSLLRRLSDDYSQDAERIGDRLAAGETEEARLIAHRLKGASSSLGLTRLQQASTELDLALRMGEGDMDRLLALRDPVAEELRALAAALGDMDADD